MTSSHSEEEDIEASIGHIHDASSTQDIEKGFAEKSDALLEEQIQSLLDTNDKSCFIIGIPPDDEEFPLNWPFSLKARLTMIYGLTTFCAQFNSSIMAPAADQLMEEFGVTHVVAMLPTCLYILGVAFGPMLFGPASEVYGRKLGILCPFFVSILFTLATASSTRIEAILITRFFSGLFAAAPIVSAGGVLADIWHTSVRGISLVFYAAFVVLAPTAGSIIGTIIVQYLNWQWTEWVAAIVSSAMLLADLLLIHESYLPILSSNRAHRKRKETGNWLYHSKHEEWELTFKEFMTVHLMRPFAMFGTPIVFFIALYASFVFGVLYLFITSASETFITVRGWKPIPAALTYIGMFLGAVCGGLVNIAGGKRYSKLVQANGGNSLPEERLYPLMTTAWTLPVGLFLFAWTQRESIHWIVPVIGMAFMGCGQFVIFQGCLNYLVDTYTRYAASAIAANTFSRSLFAGFFPLFGARMFEVLGANWGGTVLALVATAMLPIPFVFYKLGASIRRRNPYAHLVE